METIYIYKGAKKEDRREVLELGESLGLLSCRNGIGDTIAKNATKGKPNFIEVCENNPKFFSKIFYTNLDK